MFFETSAKTGENIQEVFTAIGMLFCFRLRSHISSHNEFACLFGIFSGETTEARPDERVCRHCRDPPRYTAAIGLLQVVGNRSELHVFMSWKYIMLQYTHL